MDGVNSRICWHLIWAGWERAKTANFCPLYILNFVLLEASQNANSTWLAPSMTSSHVTSYVTWESSVVIMLKHTWRQMTLLSRESIVLFCWMTLLSIWGRLESNGGVSFEVVVNKTGACSNLRIGCQDGGYKIL